MSRQTDPRALADQRLPGRPSPEGELSRRGTSVIDVDFDVIVFIKIAVVGRRTSSRTDRDLQFAGRDPP